ncbi:MAG TPA: hypothetical protein DEA96_15770 [Leptospiraceae bacterium]|nr:hypothetical protein [Spirochaetaceae bacterium]HBS06426.1 hypothetical protein [Leptospiraceae bacterium]
MPPANRWKSWIESPRLYGPAAGARKPGPRKRQKAGHLEQWGGAEGAPESLQVRKNWRIVYGG